MNSPDLIGLVPFIKDKNMDDGIVTILCQSTADLLEVESALKSELSGAYNNLTVYNPYHPHKSKTDVICKFLSSIEKNNVKGNLYKPF